jgi:hypothetical protein
MRVLSNQKVSRSRRRLPKGQEDPLVALRKQLQRRKGTLMILHKCSPRALQRYINICILYYVYSETFNCTDILISFMTGSFAVLYTSNGCISITV